METKKFLDDTNRIIIAELMKNGRVKYTDLSRKLNITPAAVKERVERLISKNILRVKGLINYRDLYPVTVSMGIEVDSDSVDSIVRRLRNCPLVLHISKTSGNHNLVITVVGEDLEFIEDYINRQIRTEKGVKHVEVNIGNTTLLPEYAPLRVHYPKDMEDAPCGLRFDDERRCPRCPAFAKVGK